MSASDPGRMMRLGVCITQDMMIIMTIPRSLNGSVSGGWLLRSVNTRPNQTPAPNVKAHGSIHSHVNTHHSRILRFIVLPLFHLVVAGEAITGVLVHHWTMNGSTSGSLCRGLGWKSGLEFRRSHSAPNTIRQTPQMIYASFQMGDVAAGTYFPNVKPEPHPEDEEIGVQQINYSLLHKLPPSLARCGSA